MVILIDSHPLRLTWVVIYTVPPVPIFSAHNSKPELATSRVSPPPSDCSGFRQDISVSTLPFLWSSLTQSLVRLGMIYRVTRVMYVVRFSEAKLSH